MQRVVEARGHSEVAAAATKPPEEVAVLSLGSADHPAVGRDEIDRCDIVARPPEPPGEIAESASERQARAAGVGDEPEHRGKAVQLRLAVHVTEETAGLSARHRCSRIDPDAAHERHVEHEPAVAHGKSCDVVSTAFDGQRQAVLARNVDTRHDVGHSETPDDQRRTPIDHCVPDRTRLVVGRLAWPQQGAPDPALQVVGNSLVVLDLFRCAHLASPRLDRPIRSPRSPSARGPTGTSTAGPRAESSPQDITRPLQSSQRPRGVMKLANTNSAADLPIC